MTVSLRTMEVLLRLADWFLCHFLGNSFYRAAMKLKNHGCFFFLKTPSLISSSSSHHHSLYPNLSKFTHNHNRKSQSIVCDIERCLLRSPSFFPYFMLVAFEGGGILRALLLLLSSPFLPLLNYEMRMRVMIFITFCGLRLRDMDNVSRAVLPKFYLENLNLHAYEALDSAGYKAVITSVPRVMVEGFLKEYLAVDSVVGTELHVAGKFFTGLVSSPGLVVKSGGVKELFGEKKPDVGIGTTSLHDHSFISLCKEAYVVTKDDPNSILPRNRYPKPLVFHDGRLAFLPTPSATLMMFLWLPIGIPLAIFRLLIGICLPYNLGITLGIASGIDLRISGQAPPRSPTGKGVLYVCTHRTLLDPVFISISLRKPLTAVTYSVSKMSEILSPIKTVRLRRDREIDGETMRKVLSKGDLVVCPEGTTCREPYLLRFSSLFAEVAEEMVPVAVKTEVSMFYGTTASGLKWLDPFLFLMNPRPGYSVRIMGKVGREMSCAGGKESHEVANYIQRLLGEALGFECTNLTRRDKYLMLAGNDGVVQEKRRIKP